MKKNRAMRTAALLMALTMITSSFVGGTFAKYVTSGTGMDSARVAKFGVAVTANGSTFAESYAMDDEASVYANSVISSESGKNVIAPGTKGEMVSATITGTPEVAVRVSYEADLQLSSNWSVAGEYYCPIQIIIKRKDYSGTLNGNDYDSAEEFEKAVKDTIAVYCASNDYPAGTNLSNIGADALDISWNWPFSTGDANDVKDTRLGDKAAAGNPSTISLTVKTTVTQID